MQGRQFHIILGRFPDLGPSRFVFPIWAPPINIFSRFGPLLLIFIPDLGPSTLNFPIWAPLINIFFPIQAPPKFPDSGPLVISIYWTDPLAMIKLAILGQLEQQRCTVQLYLKVQT